MQVAKSPEQLQESLRQVTELLERHRVLEALTERQEGAHEKREVLQALAHRQNLADLAHRVRQLHPADLAFILESLPMEDRRLVWAELNPAQAALVLLEVQRPVQESLVEATPRTVLVDLLKRMDTEDLASVADAVDPAVLQEVSGSLGSEEATWLKDSIAYGEDSVGHLMSPEFVAVRDHFTVEDVLCELRRRKEMPRQTDELFVIDARHVFRGVLAVESVLVRDPAETVVSLMRSHALAFQPGDRARQAVNAFERYGLVSAPVVDERGKLRGRLTVDAVMDWARTSAEIEALKRAGLSGEEDLYAPTWASARNRWPWLAINLVTAFIASRVIGVFESTIAELVALATLMPIVASIGGNTGNQTVALVIRGLALEQIGPGSLRHLVGKELLVGLLNGSVWGGVMGLFAYLLYGSPALGLVMAVAILLNLIVAALVGIAVPVTLARRGRDPAQGSSVLLTFTTDSMGFFIFLGLARAFLQ